MLRDQAMIPEVQRIARHIHERYPQQAQALIERWMPETERYSNVSEHGGFNAAVQTLIARKSVTSGTA
ncbi:hypothetical protein JT305_01145 [Salmonella enterica subsp. enterica serovar Senftenberg]|nr:hypothetical protein [Salmonella enterica subsp. enterica serovar Senftenberg]